jgi:MoaA/NifB/PqqE/SkfB family radical SAM enzyme
MGLGASALATNFSRLSLPYMLNFAMTYECNSRCETCNIWQIHRKKEELTLDEIRRFAERNNFFRWVRLTGGEPWLRDDIMEVARAFVENSKDLYMMTMAVNSLVRKEKVIDGIRQILEMKIPQVSITVSLDGHRELHDKIRGIPGNYDRAITMYRELSELRKQYPNLYHVFGYTMSKYNEGQFEKTYKEVKKDIPELKHNDFHVNIAHSSTNYYHNENMADIKPGKVYPEEIKQIIKSREFEMSTIHTIEDIYLKKSLKYYETGKTPMDCKSLNASVFLDPYGFLYPCTMWYRQLANIREIDYDIRNVWGKDEAENYRKEIKAKRCPNCWTPCEAHQTIVGNLFGAVA